MKLSPRLLIIFLVLVISYISISSGLHKYTIFESVEVIDGDTVKVSKLKDVYIFYGRILGSLKLKPFYKLDLEASFRHSDFKSNQQYEPKSNLKRGADALMHTSSPKQSKSSTEKPTDRIRLLAIDTPELAQAPWGNISKEFSKDFLLAGIEQAYSNLIKRLVLQGNLNLSKKQFAINPKIIYKDQLKAALEKFYKLNSDTLSANNINLKNLIIVEYSHQERDKYQRILGYVYNSEGYLLNQLLVEFGLAEIFVYSQNPKYSLELKKAQIQAKENHLNIWNPDNGLKNSPHEFRRKKKQRTRS
jgi:endonuclease YncB( thermonuclease family)